MAQNIIIGAGMLYFARATIQGGAPGAERYLGDAESASLRINEERVTVQSGSGVPRRLVDAVRSTERMIDMVLRDMSLANIALLLASDTIPVPATTVADERIAVGALDGGPWYGLPSARGRRISNLVLRSAGRGGGTIYISGEHYRAEAGSGRIRILDAGAAGIAANTDIHASYTIDAATRIAAAQAEPVTGALRYIEHAPTINPASRGRNIYCPEVTLRPNGDWALIGRTEQLIRLAANIKQPEDGSAALMIDGEDLR